jgi:hypothetical protein
MALKTTVRVVVLILTGVSLLGKLFGIGPSELSTATKRDIGAARRGLDPTRDMGHPSWGRCLRQAG